MSESLEFLKNMNTRQFLVGIVRNLAPGLLLSVAGTLIIYTLLRPHFSATSLVPLLVASLCPVLSNVVSLLRQRQLDVFGIMVLLGIAASVVGALLGGSPQLLLVRESFVTGATGLVFLFSLLMPKSLGYYFAKQFMAGNDREKRTSFDALWQYSFFRYGIQRGTIFWSLLLLSEFAVRLLLVFTLPVVLVLTIAPIVFNIIIIGGITVSAIWSKGIVKQVESLSR
jgi:hypothetical protein